MPSFILTTGEPAGIGPDLCVLLFDYIVNQPIVLCGDINLLRQRSKQLGKSTMFHKLSKKNTAIINTSIPVLHIPLCADTHCGKLNPENAKYVIDILKTASKATLNGEYLGIITAPIHKGVICQAGGKYANFNGHTEFLATQTKTDLPVMVLGNKELKVGLITTHIPLKAVASTITAKLLKETIRIVHKDMQRYFTNGKPPKIAVCGLNPHAGESGHMGYEEIEIINPALKELRKELINVSEALPADSLFVPNHANSYDIIIAMYHDQGLSALKSQGFGKCINMTFGLPIIRTSVDHGTALSLAGTGKANPNSLKYAIKYAKKMARLI